MSPPKRDSHQSNGTKSSGWPNEAGFQATDEQKTPVELQVIGKFPAATAGTLFRTGPATYKTEEFQVDHWFDGFSKVYRFQLVPQNDGACKLFYNSRSQVDSQLERIRKTGKLEGVTFAQKRDPCESIFSKAKAVFAPNFVAEHPSDVNAGVTISRSLNGNQKTMVTRADNCQFKTIDSTALEPIGITDQSTLHPDLKGPMSAAHAEFDPITGDCYNYNLNFGQFPSYKIFCTSASTGKTEILATITGPDVPPAYIHSLFLTENHVVLCLWVAHFAKMGLPILWERNLLDAIKPFDSHSQTRWYVVDRKSGRGLVKRFKSPAMFCFHTINAYEEELPDGSHHIIADLVEYPNLDVLHKLYYKNLIPRPDGTTTSSEPKQWEPKGAILTRYRLGSISSKKQTSADILFRLGVMQTGELPTINPKFHTKKHRYVYGVSDRGLSSFVDGITKSDLQTKETIYWDKAMHTPGEPIFVADPTRRDQEDGGWLLSCVLDGTRGTSYLLCLDAQTMKEVGKAESDVAFGFGFHGSFLGQS